MSILDLKELKRLCDAAIPAPWTKACTGWGGYCGKDSVGVNAPGLQIHVGMLGKHDDTAEFIAISRTAIPQLIKQIESLSALNEFKQDALESRKEVDETWIDTNLANARLIKENQILRELLRHSSHHLVITPDPESLFMRIHRALEDK